MKQRRVQPEILDSLPASDPDAIRSRRDLRWINLFMGNHRWLRRQFMRRAPVGARVLELGAGDGHFGSGLVRGGLLEPERLAAVDLGPMPLDWPEAAQWHQGDVLTSPLPQAEVVIANLFLHHLEEPALRQLGARLSKGARLVLCSEPARGRLHIWQGHLLHFLLRLNRVTRHDMRVSIEAGFRGDELVRALGLNPQDGWRSEHSSSWFGAHRVVAWR